MQETENMQITRHPAQQILFMPDVEKLVGRNRLTIRRWWMEGKFPTPVKLNSRTLAWRAQIINEWINQNIGVSEG